MVFDKLPTNHMKIIKIIALKTNISDNFQSHLKVRSKILLHWRPPEGFHFHWRGLKNRDLQFKTLRRVIYFPLEGLRYLSRGFLTPLDGFRYPSKGFITPLEGFRYFSLEGVRYPYREFITPLEGFKYFACWRESDILIESL